MFKPRIPVLLSIGFLIGVNGVARAAYDLYIHEGKDTAVFRVSEIDSMKFNALPGKNCIAYYPCDHSNDISKLKDAGGNGNHGELKGTMSTGSDRFKKNGALFFNTATSDTKHIVLPVLFDDSSACTIVAWVYPNDTARAWQWIFGDMKDGLVDVGIALNHGKQARYHFKAGTFERGSGAANAVAFQQWNMVVLRYDGKKAEGIVNLKGDWEIAMSGAIDAPARKALFFGYTKSAMEYFHGKMDDVRVYTRALTDEELKTLYHEGGYK